MAQQRKKKKRGRTFYSLATPLCSHFAHRLGDLPILITHSNEPHRDLGRGPRRAQRVRTPTRNGTLRRRTDDDRLGRDSGETVNVGSQVHFDYVTLG
jgi:hypothetical protein